MSGYDFIEIKDTPTDPKDLKCDFCTAPRPVWRYRCHDFVQTETAHMLHESGRVDSIEITGDSVGDWSACVACHALIERNDRDRLARRGAKRVLKQHPDMAQVMSLKNVIAHVKRVQAGFWEHRVGSPMREERS